MCERNQEGGGWGGGRGGGLWAATGRTQGHVYHEHQLTGASVSISGGTLFKLSPTAVAAHDVSSSAASALIGVGLKFESEGEVVLIGPWASWILNQVHASKWCHTERA